MEKDSGFVPAHAFYQEWIGFDAKEVPAHTIANANGALAAQQGDLQSVECSIHRHWIAKEDPVDSADPTVKKATKTEPPYASCVAMFSAPVKRATAG